VFQSSAPDVAEALSNLGAPPVALITSATPWPVQCSRAFAKSSKMPVVWLMLAQVSWGPGGAACETSVAPPHLVVRQHYASQVAVCLHIHVALVLRSLHALPLPGLSALDDGARQEHDALAHSRALRMRHHQSGIDDGV